MAKQYFLDVKGFCAALRKIVACMPSDFAQDCKRINTFGWLWDMSELNAENMEVTKRKYDRGEFYIRPYEQSKRRAKIETKYPVLAADSVKSRITSLCPPSFEEIEIILSVWDKYVEKGSKGERCEGCEDRTKKEIECDTKAMLEYVLNELEDLVLFSNGEEHVWLSNTFFNSAQNECYPYSEYKPICHAKSQILGSIDITHEWGGTHNLIGTSARFIIKVGRNCKNAIKADYCNCEECTEC